MSSIRARARQWRFPREFRIPELEPTPPPEPDPEPEVVEAAPPEVHGLDDAAVADVATNLWRLRSRLETGVGQDDRERRLANRHLAAVHDRLAEAGIRVQDHDGIAWDPGMVLRVLAYEPRPHLDRETVVETVRPTVYRDDRCVQQGHVIVGVPEKGETQ
ncbi:hypothetical protein ACOBQX_03290 [Actinokineospora sp. G85]|uniref:hypothetical protein n=1 Tax=Actinokineospora sp. G85 TaxID=3406626 RepID=UPI003C77D552